MDDLITNMIKKAHNNLKNSYSPYSRFKVSACILSENNEKFVGVNVENSSYGLTVCAETSAICQMISAGEKKIKKIVILAGTEELCAPCGACRQRIYEFSTAETIVYLCNKEGIIKSLAINELLPLAFRFSPDFRW